MATFASSVFKNGAHGATCIDSHPLHFSVQPFYDLTKAVCSKAEGLLHRIIKITAALVMRLSYQGTGDVHPDLENLEERMLDKTEQIK